MQSAIRHYADVITSVIGNLLKRGSSEAVVLTLRMELDSHVSGSAARRLFVHLACLAPGAYVNVFVAFSERPIGRGFLPLPWVKICSHDSAWRDDGVRFALKSSASQFRDLVQEREPAVPPEEFQEFLQLDFIGSIRGQEVFAHHVAQAKPQSLDLKLMISLALEGQAKGVVHG